MPTTRELRLAGFVLGAALVLGAAFVQGAPAALAGAAREAADPGVTRTAVFLGGTAPLSGAASAYQAVARGADAYFQYVNASGGVLGRTIAYTYLDDAYDPTQSVAVTRRLVEQDNVFAVVNSLGTEHNLAVRDYLNTAEVPQLFVGSGATAFGRDYERYPYTVGFQPSYQAEGWVYGTYLARTAPRAKIAVLLQNDDYGKDLLDGLKQGIQRSAVKVVATQAYDPDAVDVQRQVARLKASRADTFVIFATPELAIQSFVHASRLGWKPKRVINSAASSSSAVMQAAADAGANRVVKGTISISFLKDPTDPQWRRDAAIRLYRQIMRTYGADADVGDIHHVYGMAVAWTTVEVLKKAGRDLTRASLMKVVDSMNIAGNPFLLPGIVLETGGRDRIPIDQMLLRRWQNGSWKSFGGLWRYRPA